MVPGFTDDLDRAPSGSTQTRPGGSPPPLLIVGNFLYSTSGIYGIADELAAQLAGCGWSVLTTSSKVGRLDRMVDMVRTAWVRRRDYAVAQVDVFSGLAFTWAEAVCRTLQLAGKPYVLTLHGGALPEFAASWPRRVRRLLASAQAVTTPSGYLLERMSRYRVDLELCPNAIHLNDYPFRLRERARPRLVWLRTFHELYNPTLAVRVLALVRQRVPDVELLMLGPVRQRQSLDAVLALARQLDVGDRLVVGGPVPKQDVGSWLDRGDIFLNTTNTDNTPVSVMEAMACGMCVVSTNVGGVPYLVHDGTDALLVEANDAESMAAAVIRVIEDHQIARTLSHQARASMEDRDWSRILPQWERILHRAARCGGSFH